MTPGNWSLETLIGLPIVILLFVACVVLTVWLIRLWRNTDDESDAMFFGAFAIMSIVTTFIVLGAALYGWYPYQSEYHRYYKVTGQVENIGNRQISDGSTMSQRYVFRINGEEYGVDDTRASLTKVGDTVSLQCKKEWVYSSKSGWACRWDGS